MGSRYSINENGALYSNVNGNTHIEIASESDFGTAVANEITLLGDTTYIIRGIVACTNRLLIPNDNTAIVGFDRDKDGLTYTSSGGDFITITDVNCELNNIRLSSTNVTGGEVVLRANNFNYGAYNDGRDKIITILNCQIRNCYDVWHIEGFDLVDISNTLVWYVQATVMGCHFKNTSKLQITSCEFVRWFDETSLPTPSGYATTSMIELLANGSGNGFGAVNINGGIYHPQQTQNGIDINTSSTTGFGTISSNAFINVGLTTGEVFLPVASGLPDYTDTSTLAYDIYANQGVLNSTSGIVATVTGNTQDTTLGAGSPAIVSMNVTPVLQAGVRFVLDTSAGSSTGRCTYIGTKQIYVSLHITLSFLKQDKGTDDYTFSIFKNGVQITASSLTLPDLDDIGGSATLVYGLLVEENNYFEVFIESAGGDDMLVTDMVILIRE